MPNVKLDHCVIHVSDWEISNTFYRDVLGAELVPRESGWSYRFGDEQLNLHGPGVSPAPGREAPRTTGQQRSVLRVAGAYRRGNGAPGT